MLIRIERDFEAYLDEISLITILLPYDYYEGKSAAFFIKSDEERSQLEMLSSEPIEDFIKYSCRLDQSIDIGSEYLIEDEHGNTTDLQIGAVIRTKEFDDIFYIERRLGFTYTKEATSFSLWAPTAGTVKLRLFNNDGRESEKWPMNRGEKGVWELTIDGDLEGRKYTYLVCVNLRWQEAVDPYAVALTPNGEHGVIVNLKKTAMTKRELPRLSSPVDAIIYETHIRDFTIHHDSGVSQKGLYNGAAEINTKSSDGGLTGLSYAADLGVTHIQFLPFHDFAGVDEVKSNNEYNWGYNPLHFNVPDGSYSTDPGDPYTRIKELKELISTVHSLGLRVITDVVYNHVYERESSSFEKIVPGYFFRHDAFGMPSNGTGVGNDIASERKMVRKFIIDSVLFWQKEYHVDGFRFDLMGILDIETMNLIREKTAEIDSSILLLGEGWELNTPIPAGQKASMRNQLKMPGIAHFNDKFRDRIKGSTFHLYDKGYALGNAGYYQDASEVISGSIGMCDEKGLFLSPEQSINYVEAHDNHTMWDKITACFQDGDEQELKLRHRLATVLTILSQGVPFFHSGQEFFRTKHGVGNSYRSSNEINQMDWSRKAQYKDHVNYIKGMISIRQKHGAFRFSEAEDIRKHLRVLEEVKPVLGFLLHDVQEFGSWSRILVFFNPFQNPCPAVLPEGIWSVIANDQSAGVNELEAVSKKIELKPISTYVLIQEEI
ncbi:type I pullulanase [Cytobacillus gottheilii]|uniref:type I pullulanase n=1 Tax=Cytobacillus gottheilii TaxID=859144 RepID=UPI0009BA44AD|nr:type I pullulanase [Cytobacillus gottheilii]